MIISGGSVFFRDGRFTDKDIFVSGCKFSLSDDGSHAERVDASGCYVIPGLIDIHTHGCAGQDFSDGDIAKLAQMSKYYLKNGVTSYLGTSVTLDETSLFKAFSAAGAYLKNGSGGMLGINMEGPFFSEKKRGAQPLEYLRAPDYDLFMRLYDECGGMINIVCVAPELDGAIGFIKKVKKICKISIAHTSASYDQAMAAFEAGATHVTHLFNGMNSFLHRDPGVVGAAADSSAYVELICDGHHLHPSMIRSVYKLFGAKRVCMISDSLRCAGVPDGKYTLAGQNVTVIKGKALLDDGTIAGSSINLLTGLQRAVQFGITLEEAVTACTATPAAAVGMGNSIGIIDEGMIADCLVLDKNLKIRNIIKGGKIVSDCA